MKILNAKQIKQTDQATIKNEPIASIDLMERAAYTCFAWLEEAITDVEAHIHVFCGVGNNGGDGLAIARFLIEDAFEVSTYLVHSSENMSDNFITNYKRAEESGAQPKSIYSKEDFPLLKEGDIVIDAIFGTGLNRAASGFTKDLIKYINDSKQEVYAIDVPSGLFIDKANAKEDAIIKATTTLTFQQSKLAFLLPDNQDYISGFTVLNIGLDTDFIEELHTNYYLTDDNEIAAMLKVRAKYSHKGSFGHSLLIGGSFGKIGATVLASKAALRIGSGLVTAYIPKCGYNIMQISMPEVMVEVDAENEMEYFNFKTKPTVIGMGMGMGRSEKTAKAMGVFLKKNTIPLVLDADALNIISENKAYLAYLPKNSILTPHPKELERLIGSWENDFEKLNKIEVFTTKYQCILVVKGAHTVVAQNGVFYFNSTGNPGLATAGSGDVLTGIITGLLAQSYEPLDAARIGVFLHGMTADFYRLENAQETFIASDIIAFLPKMFEIIKAMKYKDNPFLEDDFDEFDDFDDDFDLPF